MSRSGTHSNSAAGLIFDYFDRRLYFSCQALGAQIQAVVRRADFLQFDELDWFKGQDKCQRYPLVVPASRNSNVRR